MRDPPQMRPSGAGKPPEYEPNRGAGRDRRAWRLRKTDASMPRDSRRLPLRPKDLWHIPAGGRREPSRWVGGGSKVGKSGPARALSMIPFTSIPHSSRERMPQDLQCSVRTTSRTSRGGSRHGPPGGKGGGRPGDFVEVARHRRIPEEGRGSASSERSADAGKFAAEELHSFRVTFKESHGEARHVRYDRYCQRILPARGCNARVRRGSITIYSRVGVRVCRSPRSRARFRSTAIRTAASDRSIEQCGAEAGGA